MSDNTTHESAPRDPEALLFQLFNEIGIISQLSSAAFEKVLPHGLTQAQFGILNHFVRLGDDETPASLASAFQVTRGTMTSTLARLEAKGFIEFRPSPTDGRSKRVLLTEAGRKAREESLENAGPLLIRTKEALSAAEVESLIAPLTQLRIWLDNDRNG